MLYFKTGYRIQSSLVTCTLLTLLSACGGGSDSFYEGYIPSFDVETSSSTDVASSASLLELLHPINQAYAVPVIPNNSRINCSNESRKWNAAPQAFQFDSNGSVDYLKNLVAMANFYSCRIREQVQQGGPRRDDDETAVDPADYFSNFESRFSQNDNQWFASWKLHTSELNSDNNPLSTQIPLVGRLINLQPNIDNSRTRVDLSQATLQANPFLFRRSVTAILEGSPESEPLNIRSVKSVEDANASGEVQTQLIMGRVSNNGHVVNIKAKLVRYFGSTLAHGSGVYSVSYHHQCEASTTPGAANSPTRSCNPNDAEWTRQVHGPRGLLTVTAEANAAAAFVSFATPSSQPELLFYEGEAANVHFDITRFATVSIPDSSDIAAEDD